MISSWMFRRPVIGRVILLRFGKAFCYAWQRTRIRDRQYGLFDTKARRIKLDPCDAYPTCDSGFCALDDARVRAGIQLPQSCQTVGSIRSLSVHLQIPGPAYRRSQRPNQRRKFIIQLRSFCMLTLYFAGFSHSEPIGGAAKMEEADQSKSSVSIRRIAGVQT